jgi:hypothetical protein
MEQAACLEYIGSDKSGSRPLPVRPGLSNHRLSEALSFDKLRVTVTQIILVRWDHRIYTGNPILHGDPFDDKAQELLTLVEGQGG